jgi:hypothetical protein
MTCSVYPSKTIDKWFCDSQEPKVIRAFTRNLGDLTPARGSGFTTLVLKVDRTQVTTRKDKDRVERIIK